MKKHADANLTALVDERRPTSCCSCRRASLLPAPSLRSPVVKYHGLGPSHRGLRVPGAAAAQQRYVERASMGYSFKCVCGHPFTDALGYEHQAVIVPREDAEDVHNALLKVLKNFLEALATGRRDLWVREIFPEPYPLDVDNAHVLNDLITSHIFARSKKVMHCPDCSRIHIQLRHEGSTYLVFPPAEPGLPNPLSPEAEQQD